jgi:patatin-like phospholipase/acyl hydrolase
MPFLNQENRHFTDAEKTSIQAALTALTTALTPKLANLTAEERQQYGSVNEQNKLIINKVKDYKEAQPILSSPDIDWIEFVADYQTRSFLQSSIEQLAELLRGMENAKILHDWDNYQAALVDYSFTQYKNGTGATGFATKEQELKQFFSRTGTTKTPTQEKDPTTAV